MLGNKGFLFSQLLGRWVGSSPSLIRVFLVCEVSRERCNANYCFYKRVSRPSAGKGDLRGVHFDVLAFIRTGSNPVPLIAGLDTGLQSKAQVRGAATVGTAKPFWSSRADPCLPLSSSYGPAVFERPW